MAEHDDATTVNDATSPPDTSSDSAGTSGASLDAIGTSALTPLCGAHCGLQDRHVGHCTACHMITANFVRIRDRHLA